MRSLDTCFQQTIKQDLSPPVNDKKKPGRKRTKVSELTKLLTNLPNGVTFTGPEGCCTEEYVLDTLKNDHLCNGASDDLVSLSAQSNIVESEAQVFDIGSFRIDLRTVKVQDLKTMRKLFPKAEYKLIKNRKCA